MFKHRHAVSRRKLLQGLGAGTFLLAPFVRTRLAEASRQGNFFVIATPNGFVRNAFGGTGSGGSWSLKPSLQALAPHKQNLAVIRGLCNKSSSTFNSHEDMCKLLSCVHGAGDKFTVYARSFDQELGDFLRSPPLTLGVQPGASAGDTYALVSWVGPRRADTKVMVPIEAFLEAFSGAPIAGGNDAAKQALLARRKSLLDFVKDDIGRFRRRLVGTDAENLDLYMGSIRDLEHRLVSQPDAILPAVVCDPSVPQGRVDQVDRQAAGVPRFRAAGEAMIDIATTAFACGTRRIATLVWQRGSGGINPIAAAPGHHDVSHGAAPVSMWEQIDRWYADRFKFALDRLAELGVMDDTITVWASEISEEHNQNDCVFVVAGGKALGIKVDQNISYPYHGRYPLFQNQALQAARDPRNRSTADLWVSVQKALGLQKDTVGDAQYCTGGLKELYPG